MYRSGQTQICQSNIATYGAHGVGSLLHFMWLLDIKFNLSCLCRQINQITKVQSVSNLKK